MDVDNDNVVNFEDFLRYLNTVINGRASEKALLSFKFLDQENTILNILGLILIIVKEKSLNLILKN